MSDTRTESQRGRGLVLLGIVCLLALGCPDGDPPPPNDPSIFVNYLFPVGETPLEGADSYRITLFDQDLPVESWTFAAGTQLQMETQRGGPGHRLMIEALDDGGTPMALGRSYLFDLNKNGRTDLQVYVSRADSFTQVNQGSTDYTGKRRMGAAVLQLSDGTIFVTGGRRDEVQTTSEAFIYDPLTDELAVPPSGTDSDGDHAFGAAGELAHGSVFVATGGDDEDPSDQYDLFVPTTDAVDGIWLISGTFGTARYEPQVLPLGNQEFLVAGGRDVAEAPVNDTQHVAAGATANDIVVTGGTWAEPRLGGLVVTTPTGPAILGGFDMLDTQNSNLLRSGVRYEGGAFVALQDDLDSRTAWSAGVELPDGTYLLIGGQNDSGTNFRRRVYHVEINGDSISTTQKDDIPIEVRRGGAGFVFQGQVLFLGGDRCDGMPLLAACYDPQDQAVLIDPANDFAVEELPALTVPTSGAQVLTLPDGTALVQTDDDLFRFNPADRSPPIPAARPVNPASRLRDGTGVVFAVPE